ncbi:MAG: hypothetical protein ABJH06_07105 [Paraglaciecola sp.]|uniref:hypothetical protein n=1 Tax=Paraglaciecola sp. TaxID=1920173 RepID=UPI003296F909
MDQSIRLFKMLLFPSFWGNAFALAFKEHWIYLAVFSLIFNGTSLMRGEFLEFIISGFFVVSVIATLFVFYATYTFIIKTFKESNFRVMVINQPCVFVVSELLGIKIDKPQVLEYSSFSDDLPDIPSKIGFTLLMVVSLSTIVGLFYLCYLIANR